MGLKKIFIIIWLSGLFGSGYAQASNNEFVSLWNDLLKVDDNEKDFQFHAFLQSVKSFMVKAETTITLDAIPLKWNVSTSSDASQTVYAGILPFQYQKNRLIVFVLENNGPKKLTHVFFRPIETVSGELPKPEIDIKKIDSTYALKIFSSQSTFFEVPDLALKILLSRLKYSRIDDEKVELSNQIWVKLEKLLNSVSLFNNKFSGYEEISTIISSDEKVKICTWNVETNDGVNKFYGGLSVNIPSGIKTYKLIDNYGSIRTPEQAVLSPSKWYGALYYDVVETKNKGTFFYTLIGYNGNDAFSQIKVVDVLVILDGNNPNPRFGHPIFTDEKRTRRRLVFEYSNRATMMLRYDASQKMIVMDNLAPLDPIYQNDYRYYGPDFSYNALKFEKGKWLLIPDVDLRNPAEGRR